MAIAGSSYFFACPQVQPVSTEPLQDLDFKPLTVVTKQPAWPFNRPRLLEALLARSLRKAQ